MIYFKRMFTNKFSLKLRFTDVPESMDVQFQILDGSDQGAASDDYKVGIMTQTLRVLRSDELPKKIELWIRYFGSDKNFIFSQDTTAIHRILLVKMMGVVYPFPLALVPLTVPLKV